MSDDINKKSGLDLKNLAMNALVTLDGEEETTTQEKSPHAFAPPGEKAGRGSSPDTAAPTFLPPDDETPLELDLPKVSPKSKAPTTPPAGSIPPRPPGSGQFQQPMPPPVYDELNQATQVRRATGEQMAPRTSGNFRTVAKGQTAPPRLSGNFPAVGVSLGARGESALDEFFKPATGGVLHQWLGAYPRMRILLGFVLALGFGSVIPMFYANSVVERRIEPLREDLSTVLAHKEALSRLPGYRSPESIEETIDGLKTRHSIYTFVMWISFAGAMAFVWFKFC